MKYKNLNYAYVCYILILTATLSYTHYQYTRKHNTDDHYSQRTVVYNVKHISHYTIVHNANLLIRCFIKNKYGHQESRCMSLPLQEMIINFIEILQKTRNDISFLVSQKALNNDQQYIGYLIGYDIKERIKLLFESNIHTKDIMVTIDKGLPMGLAYDDLDQIECKKRKMTD